MSDRINGVFDNADIQLVEKTLRLGDDPVTDDQVAQVVRAFHSSDTRFQSASSLMELATLILHLLVKHDRKNGSSEWTYSATSYESVLQMIDRAVLLANIPKISAPFLDRYLRKEPPTEEEKLFALVKRAVREVLAKQNYGGDRTEASVTPDVTDKELVDEMLRLAMASAETLSIKPVTKGGSNEC